MKTFYFLLSSGAGYPMFYYGLRRLEETISLVSLSEEAVSRLTLTK